MIWISEHNAVSFDQQFYVQHLCERETGRSKLMDSFAAHSAGGHKESLAVGLEDLDVTCKHACSKEDKNGQNLLAERVVGKVRRHKKLHRKLNVL